MKLYLTYRSPFARKVVITAIEKGLLDEIELITVDLANKPSDFLVINPLGKIPTLIGRDGNSYYESPVICEYLDSLAAPYLMPQRYQDRVAVLNLCALADGIVDLAVDYVKETFRPLELQSNSIKEKACLSIGRSLDYVKDRLSDFGDEVTPATISLVTSLGYLSFRLPHLNWQTTYPELALWYQAISSRESIQKTVPVA